MLYILGYISAQKITQFQSLMLNTDLLYFHYSSQSFFQTAGGNENMQNSHPIERSPNATPGNIFGPSHC